MKIHLSFLLFIFSFNLVFAQSEQMTCADSKAKSFQNFNRRATQLPGQELFDVCYVKLDLQLSEKSNAVNGNAIIRATATSTLNKCVLELIASLTVDSVYFNTQKTTFSRSSNSLTIDAPSNISKGSLFSVKVFYRGNPPNGGFFNGFSNANSPSWGNSVTWSLSEPDNAMHWWPCKQVLTDKIDSSEVWVTLDTGLKAGSNGLLQKITPISSSKNRYEWKYKGQIAYYLISVAVARYVDYSYNVSIPGISNQVLVQNYIYDNPATLSNFKTEIDKTGDMLKVYSRLFGSYPFAKMKYGHCMAPFNGGMEHNTMTSLGTFNTTLTAHELAHQWWGDNVTCSSWKDIWVNEGWARYCEFVYLASVSKTQAKSKMDEFHKSVLSLPSGSIYTTDTFNANSIFSSRLTYDKGAVMIHMLRFLFNNDTSFFRMCRTFQQTYGNKNATVINFKNIASTALGANLDVFFNQWYYGEGHPTFNVKLNQENDFCIVKIDQTASAPSKTPLFSTPLEITLRGSKDTTIRVSINATSNRFQIPFKTSVTRVAIDTNQWVLNDTGTFSRDTSLHYVAPLFFKSIYNTYNLSLAPNPTFDEMTVLGVINKSIVYSIESIVGKQIAKGILNATNNKVMVSYLTPGIYLFKTKGQTIKFIKE